MINFSTFLWIRAKNVLKSIGVCVYVSYRALCDVLAPLVQARAPLQSGAQALLVVPAAVRVPGVQAAAGGGEKNKQFGQRRGLQTALAGDQAAFFVFFSLFPRSQHFLLAFDKLVKMPQTSHRENKELLT